MTEDIEIDCPACGAKRAPHRWRPSPEAGPYWRCSECDNATRGGPTTEADVDHWKARAEAAEAREQACREAMEALGDLVPHDCPGPAGHPAGCSACVCGLKPALALLERARKL